MDWNNNTLYENPLNEIFDVVLDGEPAPSLLGARRGAWSEEALYRGRAGTGRNRGRAAVGYVEGHRFGRTDLFDIPEGVTYLNAAGVSPIPRIVAEAGEAGIARKRAPWTLSRASFYDIVEEAREAAAALIGARPGDIAIVGSASYGVATACRNLPLPAGTAVLTIADEHSSPVYAWLRAAEEGGAVHEEVARPGDHDWTGAILDRLADRSRPRVLDV